METVNAIDKFGGWVPLSGCEVLVYEMWMIVVPMQGMEQFTEGDVILSQLAEVQVKVKRPYKPRAKKQVCLVHQFAFALHGTVKLRWNSAEILRGDHVCR